ncbi:metalloprotease [Coemansia sp. RSA 1813]|nr:metalloprotease [Coemansia sp. RSA 1646]KAJ1773159.1 metalloprotease [Coemansia sp. RSA 1843]KAJ2216627.1 metalloprotease [Coemansia sp. RSA 487]KAJ2572089.1 metalloprotease [Coemansia sp. RSA 1813]
MIRLLRGVDFSRYNERLYIVGTDDTLSVDCVRNIEEERVSQDEFFYIGRVPRSRAVSQPWITVPWSALKCMYQVSRVLYLYGPDAVLCNGPGNCVIVGVAAFVPRILGIKHIPIIYVESFARVRTLSVSGKIMYLLADRFVVQWPHLADKYPRAEYIPNLV